MSGFEPLIVAWCFFALLSGGLVKGALGIGTPLLPVPLMALILPPQTAIVLMAVPVVVANLWQASQSVRLQAVVHTFWPAFVAVLVGTYIGGTILSTIDERSLLLFVGIAVIGFALLQGSSYRLKLSHSAVKPAGVAFGLSSGIIGGVSSFFGPMLIVYLVSLPDRDKNQFVGTISFLYLSAVVPWVVVLYVLGMLDARMLLLSGLATVPIVLGMMIGQRLRRRISDQRFQRLVLVVLLASGATMLWRAYMSPP